MRALKRIIAIAASLVMMAGIASPAFAGNESIILNLQTTEGGSFSWNLWYHNLSLPNQSVDYASGGTVRATTILDFSDTRAQSPGWSLNIAANDMTNSTDSTYIIDNANIKLINSYNNLSHGPGHCFQSSFLAAHPDNIVGNPYQTILFPQDYFTSVGVTLEQSRLMASGSAGRGCGGAFQNSFHIDVTVPGGTVPGTYSTTLVATVGNAP